MNLAVEGAVMLRVLSLPADFFKKYSLGELSNHVGYMNSMCSMMFDAIAPKPKILMFDEATLALDNITQKSDSKIKQTQRRKMKMENLNEFKKELSDEQMMEAVGGAKTSGSPRVEFLMEYCSWESRYAVRNRIREVLRSAGVPGEVIETVRLPAPESYNGGVDRVRRVRITWESGWKAVRCTFC